MRQHPFSAAGRPTPNFLWLVLATSLAICSSSFVTATTGFLTPTAVCKHITYIIVYNQYTKMFVVSVRVDEEVKRRLEDAGINVSSEVRKRLEELAWQVELKKRLAKLEKALADMPPAPPGFSTGSVREDREGH